MFNVPRRYVPSFLTKKIKKNNQKLSDALDVRIKKANIIQEKKLNHLNQKYRHML